MMEKMLLKILGFFWKIYTGFADLIVKRYGEGKDDD